MMQDPAFTAFLFVAYGSILVWLFYVPEVEATSVEQSDPKEPMPTHHKPKLTVVKTANCGEMEDLNSLNCQQLRNRCKQVDIVWRNANGKNKHMKKAQMVAALKLKAKASEPAAKSAAA